MREHGVPGSFWPEATQRTLLQVALGPAEEAAARWQKEQPLDLTKLPQGSFGLLPLLCERLSEVAPAEPQLPLLQGTYRSTWYRNQFLLERLARLLPHLRDREVDPLVVGGAAAVGRWYPALGSRPVSPLELIVPESVGAAVRDACVAAGWRPAGTCRAYLRFVGDEGSPLVVHLGTPSALAGPGRRKAHEMLLAGAAPLPSLEGGPLVLDPADVLLLLCATGASTALQGSCQWLIDAQHLLMSSASPGPEVLQARADAFGVVEPLRATLTYLGRVLETPGLDRYTKALEARGDSRDRIAFLLAGVSAGRFRGATHLASTHVRSTVDEPLARVVTGLPRHLQETWGTENLAETLVVGLRKTVRLLRPSPQRSASGRNRSASS